MELLYDLVTVRKQLGANINRHFCSSLTFDFVNSALTDGSLHLSSRKC